MITAIGQLAAVCVGIPSLIYFAIQIREQTRERRQSAVNALTVQWGDLTKALHENAEFTALFLRGVHSFHDLDAVSKLRFSAFQIVSSRTSKECTTPAAKGYLVPSCGMRLSEQCGTSLLTTVCANGGRHADTGTPRHLPVSSMQLSPGATSPRHTQATIWTRLSCRKSSSIS